MAKKQKWILPLLIKGTVLYYCEMHKITIGKGSNLQFHNNAASPKAP